MSRPTAGWTIARGAAMAAFAVMALASDAAAEVPAGQEALLPGAMLARPLFSPTRRPPPAAPVLQPLSPPGPTSPSAPDVALSGVIVGPGGGGVALMRGPLDAAPVRVRLGGTIDGWTVAEIRPRAVVLRRGGRSETVDLSGAER